MKNRIIVAVVAVVLSILVGGVVMVADWIPEPYERYVASATVLLAIATVILAVITGLLAWSALLEFKEAQRIHSFQFLLDIDRAFSTQHNMAIAKKVIKPGSYSSETSLEEWSDLRSYMGLFERIHFLVDAGIIDIDH